MIGHDLHFQRVRTIAPTARYSDDPLFRQAITPTAHISLLCINHNCFWYCCCVSIIIVICITNLLTNGPSD
jgi:hypothetical protein